MLIFALQSYKNKERKNDKATVRPRGLKSKAKCHLLAGNREAINNLKDDLVDDFSQSFVCWVQRLLAADSCCSVNVVVVVIVNVVIVVIIVAVRVVANVVVSAVVSVVADVVVLLLVLLLIKPELEVFVFSVW